MCCRLSARSADAAGGGTAPSRRPPADHHRRAYHLPSLAGGAARDGGFAGNHRQSFHRKASPSRKWRTSPIPSAPRSPVPNARPPGRCGRLSDRSDRPARVCSLGIRRSGTRCRERACSGTTTRRALRARALGAPLPARFQARAAVRADGDDGGTMRSDVLYREGDTAEALGSRNSSCGSGARGPLSSRPRSLAASI